MRSADRLESEPWARGNVCVCANMPELDNAVDVCQYTTDGIRWVALPVVVRDDPNKSFGYFGVDRQHFLARQSVTIA